MKTYKDNVKVCFWILLFLVDFSSSAVLNYYRVNNEPGLYSDQDDVTTLTINNFNTSIYASKTAWLVEFYSNWCGFCQRAAPKYKAFATDVKGWQDLVVIAALDCANERDDPVCKSFRVTRYPTFRYIHENYTEDPSKTGLPIVADSHTNYTEHRKNLVDIMRKEQTEGRGKIFPDLQPFNKSDISSIFSKNEQKYGFLVVQDPSDDVGPSLILDFHKVKEAVIKYTYNNETSIITDTVPALFKVDKYGNLSPMKIVSDDYRQAFRNVIRDILLAADIEVPSEVLRNTSVKEIQDQPITVSKEEVDLRNKIKEQGDVVFQLDLENAIRYSLKREVGGNVEIKGEKLEALRKYVNLLVKYFPFGPKGKCLLKQIRKYVNSTSPINGTQISQMVKEAEDRSLNVFSGPYQWLGCRGSTRTKRGYPCSMWKLFHYMTVNAAFDPTNNKDSNPRIVLEAMHGYIKNFFGCEDCSEHFQDMAARRNIFGVNAWEESVLWLWRAHNEVNKRLSGDATEDPEFPKVQFPTKENCPQCWKNQGTPDEVEILSYLKKMYAKENINYLGSTKSQVAQIPQVSHFMPDSLSDTRESASTGSKSVFASNLTFAICGLVISLLFFVE